MDNVVARDLEYESWSGFIYHPEKVNGTWRLVGREMPLDEIFEIFKMTEEEKLIFKLKYGN